MEKKFRLILVILLVLVLVLIRLNELMLFYDPFNEYFKGEFLKGTFPNYDKTKLFLNTGARYLMNAFVSFGIIYLLFLNRRGLYFAIKIYIVLFLILSLIYYFQLKSEFTNGYLIAFYVRRILIHPLLLLILLPIFYYQEKMND